jgi:hypothetical protein
MHRVLTLGEDWKPLHPTRVATDGRHLLVQFHVPNPPLTWGRPYDGHLAVSPADRGFTVIDADGSVPIADVAFFDALTVRISLARPLQPQALLRYADRSHGGRGMLHDSDPTRADEIYVFDPHAGHYPSAKLPELIGQPYPLQNWCVAFSLPISHQPV